MKTKVQEEREETAKKRDKIKKVKKKHKELTATAFLPKRKKSEKLKKDLRAL